MGKQDAVNKVEEVAELAAHDADVVDAVKAEEEEGASFSAVFADSPAPEPEVQTTPTQAELDAQAAEEAKAADEAKAKAAADAKPEFIPAQISTEQLNHILSQVSLINDVRESVTKIQRDSAGRIGSLEHTIKELQAATPSGKPIVVTKEHLKRLTSEYPEVGAKLAEDLTEVLAQFKGTGEAPKLETPEEFATRVSPLVDARVSAATIAEQKAMAPKILGFRHKDYAEVIGVGKPDGSTPWRQWLKTQPGDYETRMLNSWDGFELAASLDAFKAHQEAERVKQADAEKAANAEKEKTNRKPVSNVRTQRLAEAVPARGGSVVQTKAQAATEQEAFDAAFKE